MIRILIPRRWLYVFGALHCVLAGHAYGGLVIGDGILASRCVHCGELTEGIRLHAPLRGRQ